MLTRCSSGRLQTTDESFDLALKEGSARSVVLESNFHLGYHTNSLL